MTVKNTGNMPGKEIVQVYLAAPHKMTDKPSNELKAFAKTQTLQPGEFETLMLTLTPKDLASFIPNQNAWIAEAGNYTVLVGASSLNIKEKSNFLLKDALTIEKTHPAFQLDIPFTD